MVPVTGSGLSDKQNIRRCMDDSERNGHRKVGGTKNHWQGCIQVLKVILDSITNCCTCLIYGLGYFYLMLLYDTISNYSAIIGRNMSLFKVHLFKFIYAMPAVSQIYMYSYICMIWCIYMYMLCYSSMYNTCIYVTVGIGHHCTYQNLEFFHLFIYTQSNSFMHQVYLLSDFHNDIFFVDLHYKQLFEGMYFLLLIHCLSAVYHNERPPDWL